MKKVIFIYGFTGSKKDSETAKKVLDNYKLICFEYNSILKQSLKDIAEELNNFIISKTSQKEKVNLIGISAGGIIADYYAKFINPDKVGQLATVCSPFKGTYVSYFYSKKLKGLKELSYSSAFLKRLNIKKLGGSKIINFYSFFDFIVPGNSGMGENNIFTYNFFHPIIQHDMKIFKKIKKFFDKKRK